MQSKYQTIYQKLLKEIEMNVWKPQEMLPSENDLMEKYQVSRDTIRKSLQLLAQNGYIQKTKGKGSIVLDYNKISFPVSGVTSFKELAKHMKGQVETVVKECRRIPATDKLKEDMYIEDEDIWKIERIRRIDGENIILDRDYLNAKIIPNMTKEIAEDSLYSYIEGILGLQVGFARKEITIVEATQEEKEVLDLGKYDFVVLVTSYCYLEDATLFQYTESRHRPDKFRFVDFARRDIQ
ncbi:MAG: trehalose operon repressor [Coprobacillaceae bacterium]